MMSKMIELYARGQSPWLQYSGRRMLENGGLEQLEADGLRGLDFNLKFFLRTLHESDEFDSTVVDFLDLVQADHGVDEAQLLEWLVVQQMQRACDLMRPVHISSNYGDGYVSLPLAPQLADDYAGLVAHARHLWKAIRRPNLSLDVPATSAGMLALERLVAEGINTNATGIFSLTTHDQFIDAYLRGIALNLDRKAAASLATLPLRSLDTRADSVLTEVRAPEARELKGKLAIAQAKLAYQHLKQRLDAQAFPRYNGRPAVQRLRWIETTPAAGHRPLKYVKELVGPHTVLALEPELLDEFETHGDPQATLDLSVTQARRLLNEAGRLGVHLEAIAQRLETDYIRNAVETYEHVLTALRNKLMEATKSYATH